MERRSLLQKKPNLERWNTNRMVLLIGKNSFVDASPLTDVLGYYIHIHFYKNNPALLGTFFRMKVQVTQKIIKIHFYRKRNLT